MRDKADLGRDLIFIGEEDKGYGKCLGWIRQDL